MDLESNKSETSEENIWAERRSRLSTLIGNIFTQRIAYAPIFLMLMLMTVLHCEFIFASLSSSLLSNFLQAWERSTQNPDSE